MKELDNDNEKLLSQREFMRGLLDEIRSDHDIYLESYDSRLRKYLFLFLKFSTRADANDEKIKREDSEQEILKIRRILEKLQEDLKVIPLP